MSHKKSRAKALITAFICLLGLAGCARHGGGMPATLPPQAVVSTPAVPTDTANDTAPKTEAEKAGDISAFDGRGVVLVGGLTKNKSNTDAGGEFYLELSAPLELDGVSLSRLTLSTAAADGLPKYEYICSVVTIIGQISVKDSKATLDCAAIYYGERTQTPGFYELEIPKNHSRAGGALPTDIAERIAPAVSGGAYVYSPYRLSEAAAAWGGAELCRVYIDFIDAYLDYKTTVACPSAFCAYYLPQLLEREFPLFGAEVEFDILTAYDAAAGSFSWSYNTSSRAEHDALTLAFTETANAYLAGARASLNEESRARVVYHNLTGVFKYDYGMYDDNYTPRYIPSYSAYAAGHLGICSTFARACVQMMTQAGLDAEFCCCDMRGEVTGHAWVQLTIGGEASFCDPTYELSSSGGLGYIHFGMDYRRRLATDFRIIAATITVGSYGSDAYALHE